MGSEGGVIQRIHIRNFALIEDLVIDFGRGLNIITGETGAGKSIIIGALGMILGERARTEVIRGGKRTTDVEGLFKLSSSRANLCRTDGIDIEDNILLLRREMSADGRSKAFANGIPITLSRVKKIGDALIDLHGQHQHQSLLNVDTHIDLLDQYGGLQNDRTRVSELYDVYMDVLQRLQELKAQEASVKEKEELYRFQLKEIEEVNPLPGEEENLERERSILENSENLLRAADNLFDQIHQSEGSVLDRLSAMRQTAESMVRIDKQVTDQMGLFDDALQALQAFSDFLLVYRQRIDFDPNRLEEIRDRLGGFSRLKRKYGGSMTRVLEFRRTVEEALSKVEGYDDRIAECESEGAEKCHLFREACVALSKRRRETARRLSQLVENELAELGMKRTKFEICCAWVEDEKGLVEIESERYWADHRGMDRVEFFIAPNVGEEPRPLAKIASGGEISRIMLALKSTFAKLEGVPTMVFDEIDIGIGGRIAEAVGEKLKRLADTHQIICITHLPQIASLSEEHYSVVKKVERERTVSTIRHLNKKEKVEEIARLLGGKSITPVVRKHAQEMVERATASSSSI